MHTSTQTPPAVAQRSQPLLQEGHLVALDENTAEKATNVKMCHLNRSMTIKVLIFFKLGVFFSNFY